MYCHLGALGAALAGLDLALARWALLDAEACNGNSNDNTDMIMVIHLIIMMMILLLLLIIIIIIIMMIMIMEMMIIITTPPTITLIRNKLLDAEACLWMVLGVAVVTHRP